MAAGIVEQKKKREEMKQRAIRARKFAEYQKVKEQVENDADCKAYDEAMLKKRLE